ncbi:pectate lyase family protein [Celerinatantimonas yamalensis]|uniref:Pectate lyase n=1 Tax=Celerinatantimonas yamalensis TaxID=559956 RepID=A0ABW9G5N8_9GAMM
MGLTSAVCSATNLASQLILQQAPAASWAGVNGGTTGGQKADAAHIITVSNRFELVSALEDAGDAAKIIQVKGTIDLSDGRPYQNFNDEKHRSQIKIPSNTTLFGITADAGFIHGSLVVKEVHNVIIRNLHIETPVDVAPHFEKGDGWNAEWDGMNIITSEHVWVDHVTITDGHFTDAMYKQKDGWPYVQHDGALDIKRASDFVTVSYSLFENHNKTMLIGHSSHNGAQDRGKLRITLMDNIFKNVIQRTPRVRFGKIHVYNNLFIGDRSDNETYKYMYSYGLGTEGSIISENNSFTISNLNSPCHILKLFSKDHSGSVIDHGSVVNGQPVDFSQCDVNSSVGWKVPYQYQLKAVSSLGSLSKEVGSGHLLR